MMNEGYNWKDNFYYEVATGAIMGYVKKNGDGTWYAFNHYNGSSWNFIDYEYAKKSVERVIRSYLENLNKTWEPPVKTVIDTDYKEPKKFWEIWK